MGLTDMGPEPSNGVTTWVKRVVEVFDAINKIGLPLVLVGLFLATYYGWVTSPLLTNEALITHDQTMARLLDDKAHLDAQVLATIVAMRADMARNSQVYRIQVCSEIREANLRKRCLES